MEQGFIIMSWDHEAFSETASKNFSIEKNG